ncbi:MAG: polynucleotide adenylyltransferase PcnB [Candidatus Sedimenticola sp. (ex Thyasira tokunagai)]
MVKSFFSRFRNKDGEKTDALRVIPRSEHNVSRSNISENAVKVLYRLKSAGYQAHLVGGGVRDLLLGREPKDFDVATDATPEEVKRVFRNCRLIGRRFRLAHVHFGREIIEIATFRSMQDASETGDRETDKGMLVRDNVYGTIEEDALRRDFTINALYYNVQDFSVIDYAGGLNDLEEGTLRLLGDPETRYREDPVRMLRAVRFAAKLGFNISSDSEQPLSRLAQLLQEVPPARLYEEVLKLFMGGVAVQSFEKLRHYNLFAELFPQTEECLAYEDHDFPITFVLNGLKNTDARIRQGKPVTPAFLFAVLLWEPVRLLDEEIRAEGESPLAAMQEAGNEVVSEQIHDITIPKRFSLPMREIWNLQHRFEQRSGKRPHRLLTHPRFRAAYDFLLLRAESGETTMELADWWTNFQEVNADERNSLTQQKHEGGNGRRRRRRRKPNKTPTDGGGG